MCLPEDENVGIIFHISNLYFAQGVSQFEAKFPTSAPWSEAKQCFLLTNWIRLNIKLLTYEVIWT